MRRVGQGATGTDERIGDRIDGIGVREPHQRLEAFVPASHRFQRDGAERGTVERVDVAAHP